MLKKTNRLSSDFEFKITKKYGRKIPGAFMQVYFLLPRNYEGPFKVGVIVSNKFHKNAPIRNRAKRLIRESLKNKIKDIPKNSWMVIYPSRKILEAKYEEICSDVDQILQKIPVS